MGFRSIIGVLRFPGENGDAWLAQEVDLLGFQAPAEEGWPPMSQDATYALSLISFDVAQRLKPERRQAVVALLDAVRPTLKFGEISADLHRAWIRVGTRTTDPEQVESQRLLVAFCAAAWVAGAEGDLLAYQGRAPGAEHDLTFALSLRDGYVRTWWPTDAWIDTVRKTATAGEEPDLSPPGHARLR